MICRTLFRRGEDALDGSPGSVVGRFTRCLGVGGSHINHRVPRADFLLPSRSPARSRCTRCWYPRRPVLQTAPGAPSPGRPQSGPENPAAPSPGLVRASQFRIQLYFTRFCKQRDKVECHRPYINLSKRYKFSFKLIFQIFHVSQLFCFSDFKKEIVSFPVSYFVR